MIIIRLLFCFIMVSVSLSVKGQDGETLPLSIKSVALHETRPETRHVGTLTYLGGWSLDADDEWFGGWSGLSFSGNQITLVSDAGYWLQLDFDPRDATRGPDPVARFYRPAKDSRKADNDAEALLAYNNGYLVSFEQRHRLAFFDRPGHQAGDATKFVLPDYRGLSNNGGVEAMTLTPDGRLLMLAEKGRDWRGRQKGWLVDATSARSLYFKPPDNYRPTDAATLVDGSVLVLLRRYSFIEGRVSAKIIYLPANAIKAGATIEGKEIAHFAPPLVAANFEGLDTVPLPEGKTGLLLVSDNNFSRSRQTLLLFFEWAR